MFVLLLDFVCFVVLRRCCGVFLRSQFCDLLVNVAECCCAAVEPNELFAEFVLFVY